MGLPILAGKTTQKQAEPSKLALNIMHFGRSLRLAGLPIGTGKIIDAVRAVEIAGFRSSEDFYWALHGIFVSSPEHELIFSQGFHIFWRRPELLGKLLETGLLTPPPPASKKSAGSRRLSDAMGLKNFGSNRRDPEQRETYVGASSAEVFRTMDFEKMSVKEIMKAEKIIEGLPLSIPERKTRHLIQSHKGPLVDLRSTMRANLRTGSAMIQLKYRKAKKRAPPLVVICDISGSMAKYSRLLLHFTHALTKKRERVHSFVFGTRLTNITRFLTERDTDVALESAQTVIRDWSGGTRIGVCLRMFNIHWSRRVLSQGAVVILISDGLDRDPGVGLGEEMERIHKSCRRLIWLNPLLRYSEFEPRALGVKAMLPHVDEFRPVHNLASMAALAEALVANDLVARREPKHRDEG